MVAGDGVEAHAAEELHRGRVGEAQQAHHLESLLIAVGHRVVVVQVRDAAERGHVQLVRGAIRIDHAVEALREEVRTTMLFQQSAGHHLHAAGARHQVVGVFDPPESQRVAEGIGRHPVELDQAVGESL